MKALPARPAVMVGLATAILVIIGAMSLSVFTDGDQTILISVFIVSALVALAWLAMRGLSRSRWGWVIPIVIAFGPPYLLAAYIVVILNTSPGFIRVI